jgi:serine protease Do
MRKTTLLFSSFLLGIMLVAKGFAAELPDFTVLAETYSPAVVNISTTYKKKAPGQSPHGFNSPHGNEELDDLLRRFFDRDDSLGGGRESSSLGSGFIVSADGYVITNHHVIEAADEIIVKLSDRRELPAKLIGSDVRSDIALLKVEATDLPVLHTGKSSELKVGEWVVAIGSPFGFDHSVTAGIVSAKGRSLPSDNYVPFIQTDVAINPGNSGGPLFNIKGDVVGINSQIFSRSGGFMGVSFAIPIDVAMDVVDQLKTKGKVSRGWLGVMIQEVTPDLAKSFKIKKIRGALIAEVFKDSPAKGILKQGDIVIEFDGKPVPTVSALPVIVGRTKVGSEVDVKVLRADKEEIIKLKIGELPDDLSKLAKSKDGPSSTDEKKETTVLGMVIENPDETVREAVQISKGGVLVKKVESESVRSTGIRPGDIITMISGQAVENVDQFKKLADSYKKGETVAILVKSDGAARFVALKIE